MYFVNLLYIVKYVFLHRRFFVHGDFWYSFKRRHYLFWNWDEKSELDLLKWFTAKSIWCNMLILSWSISWISVLKQSVAPVAWVCLTDHTFYPNSESQSCALYFWIISRPVASQCSAGWVHRQNDFSTVKQTKYLNISLLKLTGICKRLKGLKKSWRGSENTSNNGCSHYCCQNSNGKDSF